MLSSSRPFGEAIRRGTSRRGQAFEALVVSEPPRTPQGGHDAAEILRVDLLGQGDTLWRTNILPWKITMLLMGKLTINGHFQ